MKANVPDRAELQMIVARLRQLSDEQGLVQRAYARYAELYQIAPAGRARPEDVQIKFLSQTLYFQPGVAARVPAYITTAMELSVPGQNYGTYCRFTNLDGSYRDDVMVWVSTMVCHLMPDYGACNPIEPVELSNVPVEVQDIFPRLALFAHDQHFIEQAMERCSHWFQHHPAWHHHYPLALGEDAMKTGYRWFQEWPDWYHHYQPVSFNGPEIRMAFDRQTLCFHHAVYASPYIETHLNVYASGYEVGSYCLATTFDGQVVEDGSGRMPEPF